VDLSYCCAWVTSGENVRRARTSPISRMGTLVVVAGRSLANDDCCAEESAALVEHGLFDDLSRLQEQRLWDGQPKCLGGLEVDNQVEFRWLLDGELGGLGSTQNAIDI
jgi:hypothetical protein